MSEKTTVIIEQDDLSKYSFRKKPPEDKYSFNRAKFDAAWAERFPTAQEQTEPDKMTAEEERIAREKLGLKVPADKMTADEEPQATSKLNAKDEQWARAMLGLERKGKPKAETVKGGVFIRGNDVTIL